MLRALANGETGMSAMQRALDTIANNLANLNTASYKSQSVDFADLAYQGGAQSGYPLASAGQDAQLGGGSRVASTGRDLTQGDLRQTNRPLDLAIDGPGYFAVSAPGGQTLYTRDGRFSADAQGQLVNSDGYALSPGITVPAGCRSVTVGTDGRVTATGADGTGKQIGTIQLYTFTDPQGLSGMGGNLYQAGAASGPATGVTAGTAGSGRITQGSLEQSNVSLISQMTDLMLVERSYQFDSRAVQTADSMWSMANQLFQG